MGRTGLLTIKEFEPPQGTYRLRSTSSIDEFTQNLYYSLRVEDHKKFKAMVVVCLEGHVLSLAIAERLDKALQGL